MKATKNPVGAAILQMAAITSLTQKQRIETFVDLSKSAQRAFSGMGKLLYVISSNLKKDETIYAVMRKAGIKDGTTSNASYASRVWEHVRDGIFTEAEYDTFTFQDIFAICRVTGSKSAKRLEPADVAVIVREVPDFEIELRCIFENGVTTEEKAENDRLLAAAQQQEEEDKKKNTAGTSSAPSVGSAPAPAGAASAPAPAPAGSSAPNAAAPSPTPASAPTIVPMPTSKPTAEEALRLLDSVETMMLELEPDDQETVARRVIAMAETICSLVDKPSKAPSKAAKKTAVAA